jgi:hypothetical protein
MIVRVAAAALVAFLVALGVGWLQPGPPVAPLVVGRNGAAVPSVLLARPDQPTAAALDDLADQLGSGPATAASAAIDPDNLPPPPPAPPPPAPDIAPIFRRQVSAVIDQGSDGLAVLLRNSGGEGGASRLLKLGDRFDGGWRLIGLSSNEAVLQRGRETRRVSLFGAPPAGGVEIVG